MAMLYSVDRLMNQSEVPMNESGPRAAASINDPLQHLVDCHDRIEERLQTLERLLPHLTSASEPKSREAHDALKNSLEFLEIMGTIHTRDEEDSLFPRLLARAGKQDPTVAELTTMLEAQHREKEGVFGKLLDHVATFPAAPDPPSAEQLRRLEGLVAHLTDLYRPHIMVENQRLIPLSRDFLSETDLVQMREEMRNRRAK